MPARFPVRTACEVCDGPLPAGSTAGRKTCSNRCRALKYERTTRGRRSLESIRQTPPPHGTPGRYKGSTTRPPCYCDVCQYGNALRHAAWREQRRA
jgi:predicted nucleic acid-binding Zn ribbon protein